MAFASADEEDLGLRPLHNPQVTRQIGIVSRRGVPLSTPATFLRNLVGRHFAKGDCCVNCNRKGNILNFGKRRKALRWACIWEDYQ